jgi:hypothetical protein
MGLYDTCRVRETVRIYVLYGFVAAVLVNATVLVMMVRLFLQMQCGVRKSVAMTASEADVRHRERLPQQRNDEQENGWRFAHGGNLAETRRLCRTFQRAQMLLIVTKCAVTALIVVLVSEIAKRSDKLGALIASLPLVTVMVMIWLYLEDQGAEKVARHAYYAFWYAVLRCPCFF